MATFALVHGAGDGGWAWHLVAHALRESGHTAVAPDLPTDRDDATWQDCLETVIAAVDDVTGTPEHVVLVGHSSGGFVVPLVAEALGAPQIFVAGMVPRPGETPFGWFEHVGWAATVEELARADPGLTGNPDPAVGFFHDVPAPLAREAMTRERPTSERLATTPWPLPALPATPARYVVTGQDRFIPPPVQRHVAAVRLGLTEPDEVDAGHCVHLSRPEQLAGLLIAHLDALTG